MGKYLELLDRAAVERSSDKSDESDQSPSRGSRSADFGRFSRLGRGAQSTGSTPTSGDAEEERAAIAQNDGGISSAWVEALAQLHPDRPPPTVSPRQWRDFYNDFAHFIDRWASKATAMGWTPCDLCGWLPGAAFELISTHIGLAWQVHGGSVVAITQHTATVVRPHGQRLTFRRQNPFI